MRVFQLALVVLLLGLVLVQALPDKAKDHDHDHDGDDHDDDDHDGDDQHNTSDKRLCPDGYTFAGDDPKGRRLNRDYLMDEAERSPVYSCYRVFKTPANWMSANLQCIEDKGQLVSFEDAEEISNFGAKFGNAEDGTVDLLTSAIHFGADHLQGWAWIGSNSTISTELLTNSLGDSNSTNADNQCLVLRVDGNSTKLIAVSCLAPQTNFACEIRVQTVTYYAWFVANWFTFLLIFLLIVLVLSLCISMTMYSKKSGQRDRVYRGRARQLSSDLPPSYSETQRKPDATQASRMDQYRTKGKELLAKVYLYKDGQRTGANN